MIAARLPGHLCSQRFTYVDDVGRRTTSHGLRLDMRSWIKERTGSLPKYHLQGSDVEFMFSNRGMAALFLLVWTDVDQILNDPPVNRALIDLI